MIKKQTIRLFLTIPMAAALVLFIACAVNPVTGEKQFMLLTEGDEVAMGKQYDPEVVAMYGLYDSAQLQAFISDLGNRMAKVSHRPQLKYEFKILDTPIVNAFAVPGGYVYFTRGILAYFNNEAEFVGVLGHEIGHITARHSASQYSKGLVAALGIGVAGELSDSLGKYTSFASAGLGLLFLKHGRDAESQSDTLGVEYSTKIGYDAREMAQFFATLDRMGGGNPLTFLSTHPNPANRKQKVGQLAEEWRKKTGGSSLKVNRDSYLRLLDNLVFGEDPRHGYVEGNRFYHPTLRFQFPIPPNWKTANTNTQVQIASDDQKAVLILTTSPAKSVAEAVESFTASEKSLTVINSNDTTVNGFTTRVLESEFGDSENATDKIRVLSYFIAYSPNVYVFHGVAKHNDFSAYQDRFHATMRDFSRLSESSKINVTPQRVRIKTVSRDSTLEGALKSFNISQDQLNTTALLNGMELTQPVQKGTLIKVVEK